MRMAEIECLAAASQNFQRQLELGTTLTEPNLKLNRSIQQSNRTSCAGGEAQLHVDTGVSQP